MRCGLIFVERNVGENSDFAEYERQMIFILKRATKRWLKIFKRNAILKSKNFSKRSEKKAACKNKPLSGV